MPSIRQIGWNGRETSYFKPAGALECDENQLEAHQ